GSFGFRLCHGVSPRVRSWFSCLERNSWTQFGTLAPDLGSFKVDKPAILNVLNAEATEQGYGYCHAFNSRRLQADVEELPDVLPLDPDSPFEVRYSENNLDKPLGIRPK